MTCKSYLPQPPSRMIWIADLVAAPVARKTANEARNSFLTLHQCKQKQRARREHCFHTGGVAGLIPASPSLHLCRALSLGPLVSPGYRSSTKPERPPEPCETWWIMFARARRPSPFASYCIRPNGAASTGQRRARRRRVRPVRDRRPVRAHWSKALSTASPSDCRRASDSSLRRDVRLIRCRDA